MNSGSGMDGEEQSSSMFEEMDRVARSAVVKAGNLIRERIGKVPTSDVHTKGPSDYVTEVDRECEGLILETIGRSFPDHHIVAEESETGDLRDGFTWVIDPLDGTMNFIHGFPFVAVSIALCVDRKPVLGYVLDPVREELFTAKRGEGAYLNGARIHARNGRPLREALIATGFPFRSRDVLDAYLEVFKHVFREVSGIRRAGAAALDLAYLATGRVDGFWEVGLKAWDIAAGCLLIEEAGGVVGDFWGRDDYLLNGHIVGGTVDVYSFLLKTAQRFLVPALTRQ